MSEIELEGRRPGERQMAFSESHGPGTHLCPLCGGAQSAPVFRRKWKRAVDFVMCSTCGLVRQLQPISWGETTDFLVSADGAAERLQPQRLAHKERHTRDRWDWMQDLFRRHHLPPVTRALEIGPGEGTFMALARDHGKRICGIESNPELVAHCRGQGLEVTEGVWPDVKPEGSFDLVALFHVIEHIRDLTAAMEAAQSLLTPQGLVCLETPNAWRPAGKLQKTFIGPDHPIMFTPNSLRSMLRVCGFEEIGFSEVEHGLRVLARLSSKAEADFRPENPKALRRLLRRHQFRWLLLAEWREAVQGRLGGFNALRR